MPSASASWRKSPFTPPTPSGTFSLPGKTYSSERTEWYYFPEFNCYAKWATRIYKGVLFHSLPCSRKSDATVSKSAVAELGSPASHGCVRVSPFISEDSPINMYWLWLRLPYHTRVIILDD